MDENNLFKNDENELPAEMGRIYHAGSDAVRDRDNPGRQIFGRAVIFGCIAALAMFALSPDSTLPEDKLPGGTSSDSLSGDVSAGNGGDVSGGMDGGHPNTENNAPYEIPEENAPKVSSDAVEETGKNFLTHVSVGIKSAVRLLSTASARLQLWDAAGSLEEFLGNAVGGENNLPENANNSINGRLTLSGDDSGILSKGVRRMPSSYDEEGDVSELPISPEAAGDSPLPYLSCGDEAGGDIIRQTFASGEGENYIDLPLAGQIRNVTHVSREDILRETDMPLPFTVGINSDEPQILIMHTHTTETYEKSQRSRYDSDFLSRTTDSDMNMTAVGRAMAEVFRERGINTIHDETVHDYPSYNGSYDRSRETVTNILRQYPSIKVVLDIHRDAIEREGTRVAPCVDIGGRSAAQVMIICGCDDGTMGMPDCMLNLRTAAHFQQGIESKYPGLTRPLLFDYRNYNQGLTTGSLLIEVGGHANSIDEAVYAGQLAAEGIAEQLKANG